MKNTGEKKQYVEKIQWNLKMIGDEIIRRFLAFLLRVQLCRHQADIFHSTDQTL